MKNRKSGGLTPFFLSLVIVIAAVDLTGIFGGTVSGFAQQSDESSSGVNSEDLNAGTYTSAAQGLFSEVSVTITVDESGTITFVSIDASGETPDIGGAAAEQLEDEIMESQGAVGLDSVSGATVTSKAVITALSDCLSMAAE